jgi:N-methylhydantoinase A
LVTTAGFADVLVIGRQNRPRLYALDGSRPDPIVPAELRLEVTERVDAAGTVQTALDHASVTKVAHTLAAAGVQSVAVSLLFSFLHPDHERRVQELLKQALPDVFICLSSDVLPEFREYERTSTTVAAAYIGPLLEHYLAKLEPAVQGEFQVMQSNGGVIDAAEATRRGAALVLSGPAGGVVGAFDDARRAGFDQVISFDMGGTSTDVAICPGKIHYTVESDVGGLPIRLPMIDIHTVGAGGGSIAKLDAANALRVGPESAGADPGPACYGRGDDATVTDADVVLGRIPAATFLGGTLPLDRERASGAVGTIGERLAMDVESAALGIIRVVHASMQRAIRRISIERGLDPRGFTLVAFGGAGPLHAAEMADELEIQRVLIPRFPGVESAKGMAVADEIRDLSRTVKLELDPGDASIERLWDSLEAQAALHVAEGATLSRSADLRYVGQSYEIQVPAGEPGRLREEFEAAHERRYGFVEAGRPIEIINVRLRAVIQRGVDISYPIHASDTPASTLQIRFAAGWMESSLVERTALATGEQVRGPALITQPDTATLVPPGWQAVVDSTANLILERR